MKKFRKLLRIVFIFSLFTYLAMLIFNPPLPDESVILAELLDHEPIQKEIQEEPFNTKLNDDNYEISPLFDYEIKGLVVEEYDSHNWLDRTHENDQGQAKDLCLVWGETLRSGAYKKAKYKHGEFTCFYQLKDRESARNFNGQELSNNHLVPANKEIEKLIKSAHIGDQVQIKGKLINYEVLDDNKEVIGSRKTSITREDGGNGACEIILVTEFKILKESRIPYEEIKKAAGLTALISGLLLVGLFFLVP